MHIPHTAIRNRLLPVLGLLCGIVQAAAAPLSPTDRARSVRYHHLLDAAKANPGAVNWTTLRAAYADSPAYDPNMGHSQAEAGMAAAMQRNDFRTAATLADQATTRNWMDLRAHLMGYLAYTRLNDAAHAGPHQAAVKGITQALHFSGNGVTPVTAIHVLATSEEYVLLLFMHEKMQKQSLIQQSGHSYDRLDLVHVPDGAPSQIWFNIDTSFPREAAVATGRVIPIPDTALPD